MEPRAEERLHRAPRTDTRVPYSHTFISSAADMPFKLPPYAVHQSAACRNTKAQGSSPLACHNNSIYTHKHSDLSVESQHTPAQDQEAAVRRLLATLATCSREARSGSRFVGAPHHYSRMHTRLETGSASRGCTRLPTRVHIERTHCHWIVYNRVHIEYTVALPPAEGPVEYSTLTLHRSVRGNT